MKARKHSYWGKAVRLGVLLSLVVGVSHSAPAAELARLLQDINVGALGSYPTEFVKMGNFVYFRAADQAHGYELWKTDGREGGASLVADINAGPGSSSPRTLTVSNGTLFFSAYDNVHGAELWKSDGTEAGTEMVADIALDSASSQPWELTDVEGTLYFTADDGTHGRELWLSDGTAAGTYMVTDLADSAYYSSPRELTVFDETLYFVVDDGEHGRELWKIDQADGQPSLVKDIAVGPASSVPTGLTVMNGSLYFSACDVTNDCELWKSDGTEDGTVLVKDICHVLIPEEDCFCGELRDMGRIYTSSNPSFLTAVDETLFFAACAPNSGIGLWKSDGTDGGTELVKSIAGGSRITPIGGLTAVDQTLFFVAFGSATDAAGQLFGRELWKSDGSEGGTYPLKDICRGDNGGCGPGPADEPGISSNPDQLTPVGGSLYFTAYSDDIDVDGLGHVGRELWKSDGTPAGTVLVKDICRPALGCTFGSSYPSGLRSIGESLYFSAYDQVVGSELWRLDVLWVDAGGSYAVPEGASLTLTAEGSAAQEGPVRFDWDLDEDGVYETEGRVVTFSAVGKDGPIAVTVKARITDEESGATQEDEAIIQVENVAPSVDAGADMTLFPGESLKLFVIFEDPGPDTWDATVDFGDGSPPQEIALLTRSFTLEHTYLSQGVFDVTAAVTDDDGGTGWDTVHVSVITPQEGIEAIIQDVLDLVDQGILNKGQGNGLISKLEAALAQLDKGNPRPTINQLEAFVNQVSAFIASGLLTEGEGRPLIDQASRVIAALQSG